MLEDLKKTSEYIIKNAKIDIDIGYKIFSFITNALKHIEELEEELKKLKK